MDLNNTFKDKLFPKKNLIGRICKVWTIQEAIQSLGGLPVLFPLLEQACFKTKKADTSNPDELLNMADNQDDDRNHVNNTLSNNDGTGVTSEEVSMNGEDIDCVDGSKTVLSDLSIAYSAAKYYYPQYSQDDPSSWSYEVDDELNRIEVVSTKDSHQEISQKNGVRGRENMTTSESIEKQTFSPRESVDNVAVGVVGMNTAKSVNSFQQTTSKSPEEELLRKKQGSFVVLATPPTERFFLLINFLD